MLKSKKIRDSLGKAVEEMVLKNFYGSIMLALYSSL